MKPACQTIPLAAAYMRALSSQNIRVRTKREERRGKKEERKKGRKEEEGRRTRGKRIMSGIWHARGQRPGDFLWDRPPFRRCLRDGGGVGPKGCARPPVRGRALNQRDRETKIWIAKRFWICSSSWVRYPIDTTIKSEHVSCLWSNRIAKRIWILSSSFLGRHHVRAVGVPEFAGATPGGAWMR